MKKLSMILKKNDKKNRLPSCTYIKINTLFTHFIALNFFSEHKTIFSNWSILKHTVNTNMVMAIKVEKNKMTLGTEMFYPENHEKNVFTQKHCDKLGFNL